jgi:aspartyl-tRNA(Asn)/glutamyl-tRNA(Gln) amidotransferase subunit B
MSSQTKYETVIGIEVHAQMLTESKMFCSCPNQFDAAPNANICPICTGQPGSLPVINKKAIELGIRAATALNCEIYEKSIFSRKNYFYPDLPKGYQISQYDKPFSQNGYINVTLKSGEVKKVRIHRIHFEEDAGKSNHDYDRTLVNLNRGGVPLVEIVTEADMRSSEEAGQYLRTLHSILQYADICDGSMEEGNFRCDVNISVRPFGQEKFGTKVELKNINSFKYVEKAIEYEIERQIQMVERGEKITQQTRGWNNAENITELLREKEEAKDYRYFPEPDLPALIIEKAWKEKIKAEMPELPEAKTARFKKDYQLSDYDAAVLTSSKELAEYYEQVTKKNNNPKASANWVMNELLGKLNEIGKAIYQSPVSSRDLGDLVSRIDKNEISGKIAKTVFEEMFLTQKSPEQIIKEKGFVQISDTSQIEAVVMQVIKNNPTQLADYKAGKVKLLGYFVGQSMKETKGQANPAILNEIVKKLLDQA